ncbi:isocitrate/isopropylmalate family dehydrogenase [Actinomadura rubrisoli]|uniref:isocitrate/isopropylmalate family dehydrogenase n=1 Tax=Actinomadura rubrisoli TaxID=2530368 RepID=UPI0014048E55|nr:isocitrate/isopropylmalate family dehydrogenase [Actinomadura rubrisoli]
MFDDPTTRDLGQEVLRAVGSVTRPEDGVRAIGYDLTSHGVTPAQSALPVAVTDELADCDAIVLATPGGPFPERRWSASLGKAFRHRVEVRSIKRFAATPSPLVGQPEIDLVLVHDNDEGAYAENGGTHRKGTPHEIASEISVNSADQVAAVVRYAFRIAQRRAHRRLTLVHKHNILLHTGQLWERTVSRVAREFPEVTADYLHVDAAAMFVLTQPQRFDVVVTDGLFGGILAGLGMTVSGDAAMTVTGRIDPTATYPPFFQPAHVPDDVREAGVSDARASLLAAAMSLGHLGLGTWATAVEAVAARTRFGRRMRDGTPIVTPG